MSSLDSELNSDSSGDFSDEERPFLTMFASSLAEDELESLFIAKGTICSNHLMNIMYRWMHVLQSASFDGKCMVRSWRTCSTFPVIKTSTGQVYL